MLKFGLQYLAFHPVTITQGIRNHQFLPIKASCLKNRHLLIIPSPSLILPKFYPADKPLLYQSLCYLPHRNHRIITIEKKRMVIAAFYIHKMPQETHDRFAGK